MPPELQAAEPTPRALPDGPAAVDRSRGPLTLKEAALAVLALAILATAAYASHIAHGGFYFDDWADAAGTVHPPGGPSLGHVLSYFANIFPYRPGLIIYVPLKYYLLGVNVTTQLAWAVALGVIVAGLLYGILRLFRVPWYHAWLIAALTVVYPSFDSVRLWEAASLPSVAIALALGGLWIALLGLPRRSWALHACAAALYLVSILTYEITLPLIAAAGLLYVLRAGWRIAWPRWAVDLTVVVAGGLWNGLHTTRTVAGASGDLRHLGEVFNGGVTLLGNALIPVGSHPHTTVALVFLTAVLVAGLAVYLTAPSLEKEGAGWGLREWLLLAAAGLALAVLGWMIFIPADPYYTPSLLGFTNRVNALAGFGLVVAVYATLGIGVVLVARVLPAIGKWATAITLVLGLMLGASYVHVLERHSGIWDAAYRSERTAIDRMKTAFPTLPPETTVFTSNYPAYQTIGVPIFAATWDVNGMVKLEYDDGTLSGYPITPGLELDCRADGIGLRGVGAPPATAPYGSARLLNLETGEHTTPQSRRACQAVTHRYVAGPLYLSGAY
jgi:hypothetical protein